MQNPGTQILICKGGVLSFFLLRERRKTIKACSFVDISAEKV